MDVKNAFAGKKITLMGLGVLGRGVGDAAFLAECGAEIIASDRKTADELAASVESLKKYPNITFHLGGHDETDFRDRDLIIKAAGVSQEAPALIAARAAGVPIAMSTALFAKYAREGGATIVGVTGTRGKSTVTQMIFHTLQRAGKKALLGGNVRGRSTLAMLPDVQSGDIAVLELDSWQLQGFGDFHLSPSVAVFTNLMTDHMNYYGGSMEKYYADKANIFRYQSAGDTLAAGFQIVDKILAEKPHSRVVTPEIPESWHLKVIGAHNRENAGLAAQALRALHLTEEQIHDGLESFEAVEGRLQLVRDQGDMKVYNDNNATTPEATIAALRAFEGEHIILICGGSEKNSPLEMMVNEIEQRAHAVVLLPGQGTERLVPMLAESGTVPCQTATDMKDAVARAAAIANDLRREGKTSVILLSPGFASFGLFKNEYDRNDQFLEALRTL